MELKEYVNGKMRTGEVVVVYPEAALALIECGMGCVSCPASENETLEEAAIVHGMDPAEVIDYVNERMTDLGVELKEFSKQQAAE